ncbi:MAG: hypothetical protein J4G14_13700 [Dehalococcoidia bacterium]|nr:hypothetical protein [Dehalococcoidia bacterium]
MTTDREDIEGTTAEDEQGDVGDESPTDPVTVDAEARVVEPTTITTTRNQRQVST